MLFSCENNKLYIAWHVFMLICAALDNIIFVFVASAVTVVIEAICYTTISGTSFLAFLKYINIMYGVRTGRLFLIMSISICLDIRLIPGYCMAYSGLCV